MELTTPFERKRSSDILDKQNPPFMDNLKICSLLFSYFSIKKKAKIQTFDHLDVRLNYYYLFFFFFLCRVLHLVLQNLDCKLENLLNLQVQFVLIDP